MSETAPGYTFEPLPTDPEQDPGPETDELADIRAQLGIDEGGTDNYQVKVYRYGGKGTAWLFGYEPGDDFPILERLRDDYGGGVIEIRVYRLSRTA